MHRSIGLGLVILLAGGCGVTDDPTPPQEKVYQHASTNDSWVVACYDPSQPEPAYLGGSVAGYRISRLATTVSVLGQMGYESDGEEKLTSPTADVRTTWQIDGKPFLPVPGTFRQELNLRLGILETRYEQPAVGALSVRQRVDRETSVLAEEWSFLLKSPERVTMRLKTTPDARIEGERYVADIGPRYTISIAFDGISRDQMRLENGDLVLELSPASKAVVKRTISTGNGPSSSDVFALPELNMPEISIDGPREDQDAVRSMLFYLHSTGLSRPPSPFGWSNTTYFGHAFWDADIWVMPVAAILLPEVARSIADYRLRIGDPHPQDGYRANYKRWAAGEAAEIGLTPKQSPPALMVPWESSQSGKETVPGPSRLQHHITGSVLWGLTIAEAFGHIGERDRGLMQYFVKGAEEFWRRRSSLRPNGQYEVRHVMSPDEFHVGDNDLYTNLLAQWSTNGRTWKGSKRVYYLPKDGKSLLTYDNDRLRSYKQAAAVLAIYPLQFPQAEQQARVMMERFRDKITENGPAMSESIHATIEARFGDPEHAYASWRDSWQPFTDHPLWLFSEKKRKAITYFVTGAGGCMQAFLFGLVGFRIDDKAQEGAKWSMPLREGKVLSMRPNLPAAWRSITIKGVRLMGRKLDFKISNEAVNVTPQGA